MADVQDVVVGKPLPAAGGWYLAKSALLFGFFHFSSFSVGKRFEHSVVITPY